MSWSRVFAGAAALSLAGGLSGCFQPLYSEAAHPGLVEDLHAIDVAPIANRIGHYLAEDLIADLNGTGETASPPKYRLTVTVSTGSQTPTVNSEINAATSATLTGDATYILTKVDGGAQVLSGNASAAELERAPAELKVKIAPRSCLAFTLTGVLPEGNALINVTQTRDERVVGGLSVLAMAEEKR